MILLYFFSVLWFAKENANINYLFYIGVYLPGNYMTILAIHQRVWRMEIHKRIESSIMSNVCFLKPTFARNSVQSNSRMQKEENLTAHDWQARRMRLRVFLRALHVYWDCDWIYRECYIIMISLSYLYGLLVFAINWTLEINILEMFAILQALWWKIRRWVDSRIGSEIRSKNRLRREGPPYSRCDGGSVTTLPKKERHQRR